MLKKILDKRVEQFKKDFPDFQVSKKTNSLYARIGIHEVKQTVKHTGRAVTKGSITRLGTKQDFVQKKAHYVYLLTPKGRLMFSRAGNNFSSVTLKSINKLNLSDIKGVFFIGRKYEWLKDYSNLWDYKFFQGFNSLSEAKKFLGFSFISDADFIALFGDEHFDYLTPIILAKDKKNVVRLFKNLDYEVRDLLRDYIELCQENNFEIEIPAGINKLEELHDDAMWLVNQKNADCYSNEYRYDVKEELDFTKIWISRGLQFRRLATPYEMYCQGIKQKHCIGTNYATTLGSYAFYSFTFEGKEYDLQLCGSGAIRQFYGRKNTSAPSKLREKVGTGVNLSFSLIDTKPNLENYPMLTEPEELVTIAAEWDF